jgi:hypothetical protein
VTRKITRKRMHRKKGIVGELSGIAGSFMFRLPPPFERDAS